jgi:hypothetical protein
LAGVVFAPMNAVTSARAGAASAASSTTPSPTLDTRAMLVFYWLLVS